MEDLKWTLLTQIGFHASVNIYVKQVLIFKKQPNFFSWTISFWCEVKNQIWKNIEDFYFVYTIKGNMKFRNL